MKKLSLSTKPECKSDLPIKAIQFGEGNFLRCFLDWMVQRMNNLGLFNGRIAVVQPTPRGHLIPTLKAQDNLFTVILHGYENGKSVEKFEIINTIADAINPYDDSEYEKLKQLARSDDLEFVFSNTTEAGIVYVKEELKDKGCPTTFPAKLTQLLFERFKAYKGKDSGCAKSGLTILPCELLENNGKILQDIVLKHAADWNLGDEFRAYVTEDCTFLNTLVDRVVSGYPKDDAEKYQEKLGYEDALMTSGETFCFLAIEGGEEIKEKLPFKKAGLNVEIESDITPYRLRKVRILNGAHTSNVPAAFLSGLETVDQMMTHDVTGPFVRSVIYDEIIPAVKLDKDMLIEFADAVVNRFMDPSMHHQLSAILMNCTSKIKSRVLPSIMDALSQKQDIKKLYFALAAYSALYKDSDGTLPVTVKRELDKTGSFLDDEYAVKTLAKAWSLYKGTEDSAADTIKAIFSDKKLWDEDLTSKLDIKKIASMAHNIVKMGAIAAMRNV